MMRLEVRELTAVYDTALGELKAVDDVTLKVYEKETIGVAGESGCGKSTLALAMLRLLKPPGRIKKGKILYDGENILEKRDEEIRQIRMKKVSFIPQSSMNALNPVLRIKDQFKDMMVAHGEDRNNVEKKIEETLSMVELKPYVMNFFPHELSGGMKQRVVIGMALILNPEILIADEPTTALDVVVQREILELLRHIKEKLGKTVILISHDMAVQAEITDRIAIMYAGKIVEMGDTMDIFKQPLHPYTELLISSIPVIGRKMRLKGIPGFPPDLRKLPKGCRFMPRCPKAMRGTCDEIEPSLIPIEKRREVACFLYEGR